MKRIVITGSTRGIGRGLADAFLERGAKVAISGRSADQVAQTVAELGARHGEDRVTGAACDITDAVALQGLWDTAHSAFGGIDIWINNAGMSIHRGPIWEQTPEDIDAIVRTNLGGALLASRTALTGFKAQGAGQLWNMEGFGSNGMAQPGMAAYGATKRGVAYLTKALSRDVGKSSSILVGALSPGIVVTDLLIGDYDTSSAEWQKTKRILNILADRVETVTPWLAEQVLANTRPQAHIAWLTQRRAFWRFLTAGFNKRNVFEGFDV